LFMRRCTDLIGSVMCGLFVSRTDRAAADRSAWNVTGDSG
jgi:hypothetical protein